MLRASGKKVICSFEDAGAKSLYACASANKIVINPAGGIRYAGIKTTHMYLAGLLTKIGIRGRVRAHRRSQERARAVHERAREPPRPRPTRKISSAQHEAGLRAQHGALPPHPRRQVAARSSPKGPFVASEARDANLVDGYAFDERARARDARRGRSQSAATGKLSEPTRAPEYFGPRPKIGLLYIDGDIIDGRSRNVPILDMKLVGSYTIAEDDQAPPRRWRDQGRSCLRIEAPVAPRWRPT